MDDQSISKFLSLVLRHEPELIKLDMSDQGWVKIAQLIENSFHYKRIELTFEIVKRVVDGSDKKRFVLSEDNQNIRANQGHSIKVDLGLETKIPPDQLFHGTASRFINSILNVGLEPMSRQQVHLSLSVETAIGVGQRHGKPVVLEIDAKKMNMHGHKFYLSENSVWLVDRVPKEYIIVRNT